MKDFNLPPNNLDSVQMTENFVNRENELDILERFVYSTHNDNVIEVIGEAGIGKTSLVRMAMYRALGIGKFRGGVVWLDCAKQLNLDKLIYEISAVLDIPNFPKISNEKIRFDVISYLSKRPALFIFDSFDSVIENDEIINFVSNLSKRSEYTKIIIISRRSVREFRSKDSLYLDGLNFSSWMAYFGKVRFNNKSELMSFEQLDMLERLHKETKGSPMALSIIKERIDLNLPLDDISSLDSFLIEPNTRWALGRFLQKSPRETRPLLHALSIVEAPTSLEILGKLSNIKKPSMINSSLRDLMSASLVIEVKGRYALSHQLIREALRNDISAIEAKELDQRFIVAFLSDNLERDILRNELPNIIKALRLAVEKELPIAEEYLSIISDFLLSTNQPDEAIDLIDSILNSNIIRKDRQLFISLMNIRSVAYTRSGQFDKAIGSFRELLELDGVRSDPRLKGVVLSNLGAAYIQTKQYENAIDVLRQSASLTQGTRDYKTTITVLVNAASLIESSDAPKALSMYEQIQEMAVQVGDRSAQANILGHMAAIHAKNENYPLAISSYETQIVILRELGDQSSEFNTLISLGELHARQGRNDLEERVYLSALETGSGVEVERSRPRILNRLAELRKNSGDLYAAISYANQSIELAERLQNMIEIANASVTAADCLREMYRYTEAEYSYKHALDIYEKINARHALPLVYLKLAELHEMLFQGQIYAGEFQLAKDLYQQAMKEASSFSQKAIFQTAQIQIGGLYIKAYQHSGKESQYKDAWKIFDTIDPNIEKNDVLYALYQENIGRAYYAKYEQTKEKSELINAQKYLQDAFDFAVSKKNLTRWLSVAPVLAMVYFGTKQKEEWAKIWEFGLLAIQGITRSGVIYAEKIASAIAASAQIAFSRGEQDYAFEQLATVSTYFENNELEMPSAVKTALEYIRGELGEEKFTIRYADGKGKLTSGIAALLEEARTLMGNNQFDVAAQKLGEALPLLVDDNKEEFKRQKSTILFLRGLCYREQQLWEIALKDQEQVFQLYSELKDLTGQAHALLEIGFLYEFMNSYEDARLHYIDAYRLYKKMEDKKGRASASEHLGMLEFRGRMYPQAVESLEEAQKLYIELGEHSKASSLNTDITDARAGLQQGSPSEENYD